MDEQLLLRAALLTALVGLAALWLLPELPRTEITGTLAWTNGTQALLLTEQPRWADLQAPTDAAHGSCVTLRGYEENGRLTKAFVRRAEPQLRRRCP